MRADATPARTPRLVLAMMLAAAMLLPTIFALSPGKAEARMIWCAGDPAIVVNGSVVSVTAHLPLHRLSDVDHVEVVFHVPSNANVTAVINDSVLFEARPRVVYDLPAQRTGLFNPTKVMAEIIVHHEGDVMPVAATTISLGWGSSLWTEGTSAQPLTVTAYGLLNLRLL